MVQADKVRNDIALAGPAKLDKPAPRAESEPDASVLTGEDGTTIIHNDVVAKIAGMAVREIDGVKELVPFGAGQQVTSLARRVTGKTMRALGVHVELGKVEAAVDVRIVTVYGASIVGIATAIRENVRERVESMTGLRVVEINIEVVDLFFPSGDGGDPTDRVR